MTETFQRGRSLLIGLCLAAVVAGVYWPATRHDFINYDDDLYVTSNVHVRNGLTLESIKWAFFNPVSSNWHPLAVLSHMVDCQLFGLKPWGHHLTSVLLHAVSTVLVFLFLRRMTGEIWRSLLVAALFGVHPLHVESVAWVAERKDVLSACFGFLALLSYARYAQGWIEKGREQKKGAFSSPLSAFTSGSYWLAFLFFLLGLMSKPMLVTWPFVMLLLDYWPLERFKRSSASRLVMEKIPFFALAAVTSVVTLVVQKQGGALEGAESLPPGARSGNALISYCRYLGKLFWPTDLAVFYPHPGYWPMEEVLLAGVLIVGISALLFVKRRRYPFLLMGWLWFCGTLVPVIGLVQAGIHAMADRYTYIPSPGVLILAIWGAYELTRRWPYQVIALPVGGSAAIVLCIGLTRQQLGHWKNSETVFRHALAVTTGNHVAHYNLGVALFQLGKVSEAIEQYELALRIEPDNALAHNNLGAALFDLGKVPEALAHYRRALEVAPQSGTAQNNLAWVLATCANVSARNGARAVALAEQAERLSGGKDPGILDTLAAAYAEAGRFGEAVWTAQRAIELAKASGDRELVGQIQARLQLYQAGHRYHGDSPLPP